MVEERSQEPLPPPVPVSLFVVSAVVILLY